jgi:hypothetical protein
MSKLIERYPGVQRLPASDDSFDDVALLQLLEPYLNWVLAEVDTASLDILICTADSSINAAPKQVVLLHGRAVNLWLQNHHHSGGADGQSKAGGEPVG